MQDISPSMIAAEISAKFAVLWQKHYQTGPVCLYLADHDNGQMVEAVTVDDNSSPSTLLLTVPDETAAIDSQMQSLFSIKDASPWCDWLLDQINWSGDLSRTKILPLLIQGRAVGALIFEYRLPVDPSENLELFSAPAATAASVIALSQATEKQSRLAEDFASLLSTLKDTRNELAETKIISGVSEMAAGAAHELNNPLAVISGRAQLLCDSEDDEDKKQMLTQIYERTVEMKHIVSDLMSFAKPTDPTPKEMDVESLVSLATSQAAEALGIGQVELGTEGLDGLGKVFVDSQHMTIVFEAIIVNALQSYKGGNGPVTITANCRQVPGYVTVQIIDTGCGMDRATLEKATQPFFSAKAAGRNRGMGLAHAKRLLQVNNGSMYISSHPKAGTAVTVKLPTC
jgi:signal transduction histidine kinase